MQKWAKHFLNDNDLLRISQAVHKAELKTTGEVVPMVVRKSTLVGQVPITLIMSMYFLLMAIYILCPWHHAYELWLYAGLTILAWPLSYVLSKSSLVQRLATSRHDQRAAVWARAEVEFYRHRVNHTQANTGILIFVSLMERQCVILADQGITQKLPPDTWSGIVNEVTGRIRRGQPAESLMHAIQKCGELLTQHFPAYEKNPNELVNELVIKE